MRTRDPGARMLAEIREQPAVLARLVRAEQAHARALGKTLRERGTALAVLAARGSSDHAAVLGKYALEWSVGVPVALAAPSIATLYGTRLRLGDAAVVGVSQSGRSPDIVEYVRMAAKAGAFTIGITNEPGSPLAKAARETLLCRAGKEMSVAATKTFTAQLACFYLLASAWAGGERGSTLLEGLEHAPARLKKALGQEHRALELARRLAGAERCVVLARGFSYPTALEIALKLKESAALPSEGASAADYLHGPIAAAGPGLAAILLGPEGPGLSTMREAAEKLKKTGAEILSITHDRELAKASFLSCDPGPDWPEPLSPLPIAVIGQLTAYHLARLKGLDPDRPAGLTKVTKTW